MSSLSCRASKRHGFKVAHFSDKDNVRVFAKRPLESGGKGLGMAAHFPLVDQTLLVFVDKLDRVLDREDMSLAFAINLVEHCGKCGRFTTPGRTGNKHQAFFAASELLDHPRQMESRRLS